MREVERRFDLKSLLSSSLSAASGAAANMANIGSFISPLTEQITGHELTQLAAQQLFGDLGRSYLKECIV